MNLKLNYPLAQDSWNWREKVAILKVMASGHYTMGPKVAKFEKDFAAKYKRTHAIMVNSGSSANLIGMTALFLKERMQPGDEVIVPAVSWSTTYFPIVQLGMIPVFVDVDIKTFNISLDKIKEAITPKTRMVFGVSLLGMPMESMEIKMFCAEHGIHFAEDNCESLGATQYGWPTGSFGIFGTSSFFFSHHMSTMEGGMITTNDDVLADYCRSLRAHGWTRGLKTNHLLPKSTSYDQHFTFVLPGYCVRPLEMSGAVGITQLKKIDKFIKRRRQNAEYFKEHFGQEKKYFIQTESSVAQSSWFGFGVVLNMDYRHRNLTSLQKTKGFVTKHIREVLEDNGVQTRPIVAGNFVNQPVMDRMKYRVSGELINSENIDKNGFFFGNDHRDLGKKISLIKEIID